MKKLILITSLISSLVYAGETKSKSDKRTPQQVGEVGKLNVGVDTNCVGEIIQEMQMGTVGQKESYFRNKAQAALDAGNKPLYARLMKKSKSIAQGYLNLADISCSDIK